MAPTDIDALSAVAQEILDAVVIVLDTTAAGAPSSQFMTAARPAIDCEFVAVQMMRLAEDTTSPLTLTETKLRKHFGNIILASYTVWVVRCAPVIDGLRPPSDAQKTANAITVQTDAWALWNGIRAVQDDLFDACLGVYIDGGTPVPESGGFVGWQFAFRASIEGYEN